MEKVVLGLSGGVDSAVCARLLQDAGYEVHGLYLDIGTEEARKDAVDTAAFLNVPLTVLDISSELEKHVCAPFLAAYLRGETVPGSQSGWTLIQVDGLSLGWAKGSGGVLKNHFPKALRHLA